MKIPIIFLLIFTLGCNAPSIRFQNETGYIISTIIDGSIKLMLPPQPFNVEKREEWEELKKERLKNKSRVLVNPRISFQHFDSISIEYLNSSVAEFLPNSFRKGKDIDVQQLNITINHNLKIIPYNPENQTRKKVLGEKDLAFYTFSPPIFDENFQKAVLLGSFNCGRLCFYSHLYLLEKGTHGDWEIVKKIGLAVG